MRNFFKIFLLTASAFVAGAAAMWFAVPKFSGWLEKFSVGKNATAAAQGAPLPPRIAGTVLEPDPYANTPTVSEPEKILSPSADEAEEIIDLLRTQFIDAPSLISRPLTPDTLAEVFAKHAGKARLSDSAVMTPDPRAKTILQPLPPGAVYWRPSDFSPKELDALLKQWPALAAEHPRGLIIDLRNFRDANNLHGAAAAASLLVSPQTVLFTVEGLNFPQQVFRAQRQPLGLRQDFPVIILTNQATRGAAEALAFVLRQKGAALTVGKNTAGEGGLFTETKLKSGRYLRLATASISGADGTLLLGAPLAADVPVDVVAGADEAAFYGAYHYGAPKTAAVKVPDRATLKEREEMDLPLDNNPDEPEVPHDVILSVAADVLAGITLSAAKTPPAGK